MFILKNHCPQILRPVLTGQSKPSKASEKKKKRAQKKKKNTTQPSSVDSALLHQVRPKVLVQYPASER